MVVTVVVAVVSRVESVGCQSEKTTRYSSILYRVANSDRGLLKHPLEPFDVFLGARVLDKVAANTLSTFIRYKSSMFLRVIRFVNKMELFVEDDTRFLLFPGAFI